MPIRITISGSYRKHLDRILEAREQFEALGAEVIRPRSSEVVSEAGDQIVRMKGDPDDPSEVRSAQFAAIREADFVYVVNPGGYIGPAATLESGYALRDGTPVVSAEPPFEADVEALVQFVGDPERALRFYANLREGER